MSWKEEYSELLRFLDECTRCYPSRLFNVKPEKDSTPVRQVAFALENIADQLKKPLVSSTQALAEALVYKFNGPHRRQGYWMIYKNLLRAVRKFNADDLASRVLELHKKALASGVPIYMPSAEALRYVCAAFLKRLFRLQQIRDLCIRTSHVIMGQIELGHWERFSLFMVALCADINNGVRVQVASMEPAYNGFISSAQTLDERFPRTMSELSIFLVLRGRTSAQSTADLSRVMNLLQMSSSQIDAARTKDQMVQFRHEVLSNIESKEHTIDVGVTIERNGYLLESTPRASAIEEDSVSKASVAKKKRKKRKIVTELHQTDDSTSVLSPMTTSSIPSTPPDLPIRSKKKKKATTAIHLMERDSSNAGDCEERIESSTELLSRPSKNRKRKSCESSDDIRVIKKSSRLEDVVEDQSQISRKKKRNRKKKKKKRTV
ncbi:hypothetical protein Q1695_011862 [Nippostrongylus brasiliensis]|nr:hypothetical protein Q1695_011862 [Nippostrongylus brasiliensis]